MRTAIATLTLAAALTLGAGAAHAQHELSLRAGGTYTTDDGIFATSNTAWVTIGQLGYAKQIQSIGLGALWVEGSWEWGGRNDRLFGLESSLFLEQITVGARINVTIPRAPWLVPHMRLGLGALVGQLRLTDSVTGHMTDWSSAFSSYALAGVEVLIPRRWMRTPGARGFTMGVVIEGGWTFTTALGFTMQPDFSDDKVHTPLAGTDLGGAALNGPVVRGGVVVRF